VGGGIQNPTGPILIPGQWGWLVRRCWRRDHAPLRPSDRLLFFCDFVGHAGNKIDEVFQQISRGVVVRMVYLVQRTTYVFHFALSQHLLSMQNTSSFGAAPNRTSVPLRTAIHPVWTLGLLHPVLKNLLHYGNALGLLEHTEIFNVFINIYILTINFVRWLKMIEQWQQETGFIVRIRKFHQHSVLIGRSLRCVRCVRLETGLYAGNRP